MKKKFRNYFHNILYHHNKLHISICNCYHDTDAVWLSFFNMSRIVRHVTGTSFLIQSIIRLLLCDNREKSARQAKKQCKGPKWSTWWSMARWMNRDKTSLLILYETINGKIVRDKFRDSRDSYVISTAIAHKHQASWQWSQDGSRSDQISAHSVYPQCNYNLYIRVILILYILLYIIIY